MSPEVIRAASNLLERCRQRGLTLATAESCTGGLIIACLTEIAGSSDVVDRGFITYSNAAKMEMLGVAEETLDRPGAVSEEVASEMAAGALAAFKSDWALGVTGIAGPGGGTKEKPVGLVYIGLARDKFVEVARHEFGGSRHAVKQAAADAALAMLWRNLS